MSTYSSTLPLCSQRSKYSKLFGLSLLALLMCVLPAQGGSSRPPTAETLDEIIPQEGEWQRFEVTRRGFSKKIRFHDTATEDEITIKYKGIPVSWGSPINLLVDESKYSKSKNRVNYRFEHPLNGRPLVLRARSIQQTVGRVPIRDEGAAPTVELLDGETKELLGSLRYRWDGPRLFEGQFQGRSVFIERLGEPPAFEKGVTGYFLAPYPIFGEYVIRIDDRPAAVFVQYPQRGTKSPFDLALRVDQGERDRDEAMIAFVIFDLMKVFVE